MQIVNLIRGLGIEISDLRGQGYDGAGNMSGKKGVYRPKLSKWMIKPYMFTVLITDLILWLPKLAFSKSAKFNGCYQRNFIFF